MGNYTFRTVLVVGDNADDLIKKYDLDTKVEPYVRLPKAEWGNMRETDIEFLENLLSKEKDNLTEEKYNEKSMELEEMKSMSDDEYFKKVALSLGCTLFDNKTGDALSTKNRDARYQHACNPQKALDYRDEEHDFCNPFILVPLEGEENEEIISYTAKKSEIDWKRMHMWNTALYERAWELCVNGAEPQDEQERVIKANMENRVEYFSNFDNKEDYVFHSCSFWCFAFINNDGYKDMERPDGLIGNDGGKKWVKNFYDRFIAPLDDNETLSLYVVRKIDEF